MNRQPFGRSWRAWRAKSRLFKPLQRPRPGSVFSRQLLYPELDERLGAPPLAPYDALAAYWHPLSHRAQPNYVPFLEHLFASRGERMGAVLDLACGAGTLSERLAAAVPEVVGLDASAAMLAQAQARCANLPNVSFAEGDFRTFALGRTFDAVVCAGNSINYVADACELGAVLCRVAAHLRPGGVFVFDVLTERAKLLIAGVYEHAVVAGRRLALHFDYDPATRVAESKVLTTEGVETHRQIPIDPCDVQSAAAGSGLQIDEYFGHPWRPWRLCPKTICFFVLTRV